MPVPRKASAERNPGDSHLKPPTMDIIAAHKHISRSRQDAFSKVKTGTALPAIGPTAAHFIDCSSGTDVYYPAARPLAKRHRHK